MNKEEVSKLAARFLKERREQDREELNKFLREKLAHEYAMGYFDLDVDEDGELSDD